MAKAFVKDLGAYIRAGYPIVNLSVNTALAQKARKASFLKR